MKELTEELFYSLFYLDVVALMILGYTWISKKQEDVE